MKIKLVIRIFAAVILIAAAVATVINLKRTSPASATVNDCTIIIDAGHGGMDGGAVGEDGTLEKDLNLDIALRLKEYFTLTGFYVEMTREDDLENTDWNEFNKAEDMNARVSLMNSFPNAVVISIHQNKFSDEKYSGAQVFYSENNEESKLLAECIKQGIKKDIQPENQREIKPGNENSCVLSMAENPAVIVECGFLSNTQELNLLKDENYRSKLAFSIYSSTINFLNLQE